MSTGVISTGFIPIHHIRIGDNNGANSGNYDDSDNSIVSSSYSLYFGRTTKQTKEKILQQRVVCVKKKLGPKDSTYHNIHHTNVTNVTLQTFDAAYHSFPKNSEGGVWVK